MALPAPLTVNDVIKLLQALTDAQKALPIACANMNTGNRYEVLNVVATFNAVNLYHWCYGDSEIEEDDDD